MKCYYDPTQDAVALCRACGRGLSHEHLTEVSTGVACKGRCEEQADVVNRMIERSASSSVASNQMIRRMPSAALGSGIFLALMGLLFSIQGYQNDRGFTLKMGVICIAFGLWSVFRALRQSRMVASIQEE